MKMLMMLTSHDQLADTGHKTGLWMEELAAPFYIFRDAGADVVLASPKGGQAPIEPPSVQPGAHTSSTRRFDKDVNAKRLLAATIPIRHVLEEDFDAVLYVGGHGALWDLAEHADSIQMIHWFLTAGKPVALLSHASSVLRRAMKSSGRPIVEGKRVTGFTNAEEQAIGLGSVVPFSVEDELQALGGLFSKAAASWEPHVVFDGPLITGQNSASAASVARGILQFVADSAADVSTCGC